MRVEYRTGRSPEALDDLANDSVDLVLHDPPYGTQREGDWHGYGRRPAQKSGGPRSTTIANDFDLSELERSLPTLHRVLQPAGLMMVFAAPSKRREVIQLIEGVGEFGVFETIPWDKGYPGMSYKFRWSFEDIHIVTKDDGLDVWAVREPLVVPLRVPRVRRPEHPHEKPVELYRRLIQWALPVGGLIVDPFAGIASCGVAAVTLGCSYIGVECDPQWIPIGERRLAEVQNKPHSALKQRGLFEEIA